MKERQKREQTMKAGNKSTNLMEGRKKREKRGMSVRKL